MICKVWNPRLTPLVVADTPVMNNMRKIPMRRETIKALEVRRNTVMGEQRRKSTMQTLGANNEFNRNKGRHRNSATITGNVERIYSPNGSSISKTNEGYEMSSDDDRSTRNSVRISTQPPLPQQQPASDLRNSQM